MVWFKTDNPYLKAFKLAFVVTAVLFFVLVIIVIILFTTMPPGRRVEEPSNTVLILEEELQPYASAPLCESPVQFFLFTNDDNGHYKIFKQDTPHTGYTIQRDAEHLFSGCTAAGPFLTELYVHFADPNSTSEHGFVITPNSTNPFSGGGIVTETYYMYTVQNVEEEILKPLYQATTTWNVDGIEHTYTIVLEHDEDEVIGGHTFINSKILLGYSL